MNKIARTAINLIGEKYRNRLYRKMCIVPDEAMNPDIIVEIASTSEDLYRAYSLLHDCYVSMKLMEPQPSGLRCNLFSFLPTTTTVVAKLGSKVIGTVSLVKDSKMGLPSDKEFLAENNRFRKQQKILIEGSALAVAPQYRSTHHGVSLLLMKYLYNYCKYGFQGRST